MRSYPKIMRISNLTSAKQASHKCEFCRAGGGVNKIIYFQESMNFDEEVFFFHRQCLPQREAQILAKIYPWYYETIQD